MSDFGISLGIGEVAGELFMGAGEAAGELFAGALTKVCLPLWVFLGPGCTELNSSEAEWIEEAKRREEMYKFLRLGIVKTNPNISEEELEKQVEVLYDEIFNKGTYNSYALSIELIKSMGDNINNISVDGNNAKVGDEDNYNDTPAARRANLTIHVGGGGKEPDKKPDKDPKKIAAKVIAGAGATVQVASMLKSSTNNQDATNDVTSPFDTNTITRVTDTGIGQVVIEYKDGTRRIFDKDDVPDNILAMATNGVSDNGGINNKGAGEIEIRIGKEDLDALRKEWNVAEKNTIAVGKTDVPGLEDITFKGGSPGVRKEAGFENYDISNPNRVIKSSGKIPSATRHAEEVVANEFVEAVEKAGVKPEDVVGTLRIHQSNPSGVCPTCLSGLGNPKKPAGVIKQLSLRYPNLTIEVTSEIVEGVKVNGRLTFKVKNGSYIE